MLKNIRAALLWVAFVGAAAPSAAAATEPVPDFGELRTPPPHVASRARTYFGISTAIKRGTTLILIGDATQCQAFVTKSAQKQYSLNGKPRGTDCQKNNVIGLPEFFAPTPPGPPETPAHVVSPMQF